MPDYISVIILIGGVSIFIASLFHVRAYYRFRKVSRGFVWDQDPRVSRPAAAPNRVEAAAALIKSMDDVELMELSNRTGIGLDIRHST